MLTLFALISENRVMQLRCSAIGCICMWVMDHATLDGIGIACVGACVVRSRECMSEHDMMAMRSVVTVSRSSQLCCVQTYDENAAFALFRKLL